MKLSNRCYSGAFSCWIASERNHHERVLALLLGEKDILAPLIKIPSLGVPDFLLRREEPSPLSIYPTQCVGDCSHAEPSGRFSLRYATLTTGFTRR